MVFGNIFKVLSIPNHKSWGVEILRECSAPTMCHMSHIICHMSGVRCQVSPVMCHFCSSFFSFLFLTKWWRLLGKGLLSMGPTPSSCMSKYKFEFYNLYFPFCVSQNILFSIIPKSSYQIDLCSFSSKHAPS